MGLWSFLKSVPLVGNVLSVGEEIVDGVPKVLGAAGDVVAGVVTFDGDRILRGVDDGLQATGELGAGVVGGLLPGSGTFYDGAELTKDGFRHIVKAGGGTTATPASENLDQLADKTLHGTLANLVFTRVTGRRIGDTLGVTPTVKVTELAVAIDEEIDRAFPTGSPTVAQRNELVARVVGALPPEVSISSDDGQKNCPRDAFIAANTKVGYTAEQWENWVQEEARKKHGEQPTSAQVNELRKDSVKQYPNAVIVDERGVPISTPTRYAQQYERYEGRKPVTPDAWEKWVHGEARKKHGDAPSPEQVNAVRRESFERFANYVLIDSDGTPLDHTAHVRRMEAYAGRKPYSAAGWEKWVQEEAKKVHGDSPTQDQINAVRRESFAKHPGFVLVGADGMPADAALYLARQEAYAGRKPWTEPAWEKWVQGEARKIHGDAPTQDQIDAVRRESFARHGGHVLVGPDGMPTPPQNYIARMEEGARPRTTSDPNTAPPSEADRPPQSSEKGFSFGSLFGNLSKGDNLLRGGLFGGLAVLLGSQIGLPGWLTAVLAVVGFAAPAVADTLSESTATPSLDRDPREGEGPARNIARVTEQIREKVHDGLLTADERRDLRATLHGMRISSKDIDQFLAGVERDLASLHQQSLAGDTSAIRTIVSTVLGKGDSIAR